jgi:DNA-binding Lrp family transcriptional regulator
MDDKDRQLITLLRQNARLPVAALAQSLGVSRGTAQNRINRLIAHGTIQGFTIRVPQEAEPARIRAITMVSAAGTWCWN